MYGAESHYLLPAGPVENLYVDIKNLHLSCREGWIKKTTDKQNNVFDSDK